MRAVLLSVAALAAAGAVAVPALGAGASERLTGVVAPTIGSVVDAHGAFVGAGGTQPATVTREDRGATVVVTIVPRI